ncbi:MAG TPA: DUF1080 domain-containing protein [Chloroflexota bacterium]|nr:DUF1080 domain-containing protein [Chloroflexota bacterium]
MGDWVQLFDGKSLAGWRSRADQGGVPGHAWQVVGDVHLQRDNARLLAGEAGSGAMLNGDDGRTVDLHSISEYGSCELHVEFCVAAKSNSGVYLMGEYEIQVLDSWGTPDGELTVHSCGAIYPRWDDELKANYEGSAPRKNASTAPGTWQSFDVLFHAPRFAASGDKLANARFERLIHNGVVIQENVECSGPTRGAWQPEDIARGPLRLQGDHGPVAFRNIRLRPLDA